MFKYLLSMSVFFLFSSTGSALELSCQDTSMVDAGYIVTLSKDEVSGETRAKLEELSIAGAKELANIPCRVPEVSIQPVPAPVLQCSDLRLVDSGYRITVLKGQDYSVNIAKLTAGKRQSLKKGLPCQAPTKPVASCHYEIRFDGFTPPTSEIKSKSFEIPSTGLSAGGISFPELEAWGIKLAADAKVEEGSINLDVHVSGDYDKTMGLNFSRQGSGGEARVVQPHKSEEPSITHVLACKNI